MFLISFNVVKLMKEELVPNPLMKLMGDLRIVVLLRYVFWISCKILILKG